PAIGQVKLAASEVKVEPAGEGPDMRREFFFQGGEGAGKFLQLRHRAVAGVSSRIILSRPGAPGGIELAQLAALFGQRGIEAGLTAALQRFAINEGGEPGADGHESRLP